MKATGVVRRVDQLGRVVLPKDLRRTYCIKVCDSLEIFTEDETIILKKYEPACVFCGESRDVTDYKGKRICKSCFAEMQD